MKFARPLNQAATMTLLFALSGCASPEARLVKLGALAPVASRNGRVILSVGAPSPCGIHSTFLEIERPDKYLSTSVVTTLVVDERHMKSDFPDHQGHIYVISMPAGEYKIYPIQPGYNRIGPAPTVSFFVRENENLYAGEYYVDKSCSTETHFNINNEEDRDLKIISEINHNINKETVVVRLLSNIQLEKR